MAPAICGVTDGTMRCVVQSCGAASVLSNEERVPNAARVARPLAWYHVPHKRLTMFNKVLKGNVVLELLGHEVETARGTPDDDRTFRHDCALEGQRGMCQGVHGPLSGLRGRLAGPLCVPTTLAPSPVRDKSFVAMSSRVNMSSWGTRTASGEVVK